MLCINCGKELPDDSRFCPFCGGSLQPQPEQMAQTEPTPQPEQMAQAEPTPQEPKAKQPLQLNFAQIGLFILVGFTAVAAFRDLLTSIDRLRFYDGFVLKAAPLLHMIFSIGLSVLLFLIAVEKQQKKTDLFFATLSLTAILMALGSSFVCIFNMATSIYHSYFTFSVLFNGLSALLTSYIYLIVVVGITFCFLNLSGRKPSKPQL